MLAVPTLFGLAHAGSADAGPVARSDKRHRLRELEADYPGRIGVSAFNTGDGRAIAYRAGERFAIASTFKVLAAAAILRKARRDEPGLLDRVVHYTRADLVPHSPITEKHVATGMTVARLCEATITHSDNTAGNLLLRELGGPGAITAFTRTLGDHRTRLDRWETELNSAIPGDRRDTTTPGSMTRNLYALTLGHGLVRPDRERLTGWLLANTTGGGRIRAGVPSDWKVGDKTGTPAYGGVHDVAIVWPPDARPLIISVYTTRTDPDTPGEERVVRDITRVVVDAIGPR
ncbi:beta-lactamase class A [Actinokineospora iranica]|uniref:Beta-lactamase n=2 Tax=Actinokineospora iranica TaxID=1271860 RepID=A0A1G6S0Z8_9PSEU|nr:beta-lactamase class A [Actinokineospora iranica]